MNSEVYEALFGLIVPEICPRCHGRTQTGFCVPCRRDFVVNEHYCAICGLAPEPRTAGTCAQHTPVWHTAAVRAPYLYCRPMDRYLHALKFTGERRFGRALGQLLAADVFRYRENIDALVAVPLHKSRLLERGYNQALEISRTLAYELRLPILRAGIVRTQPTAAQSTLSARQRRRNLLSAFSVHRDLTNRSLAIVDDVITTGATVNALALELLAAGAVRVEAWAVARTPRPSPPGSPTAAQCASSQLGPTPMSTRKGTDSSSACSMMLRTPADVRSAWVSATSSTSSS
jgi:ComF family protein